MRNSMPSYLSLPSSFSLRPPPPRSTPFPYTTLFRSGPGQRGGPRQVGLVVTGALDGAGQHPGGDQPALAAYQQLRGRRSEEHTSELQLRGHLVCRLLLEKKKEQKQDDMTTERKSPHV